MGRRRRKEAARSGCAWQTNLHSPLAARHQPRRRERRQRRRRRRRCQHHKRRAHRRRRRRAREEVEAGDEGVERRICLPCSPTLMVSHASNLGTPAKRTRSRGTPCAARSRKIARRLGRPSFARGEASLGMRTLERPISTARTPSRPTPPAEPSRDPLWVAGTWRDPSFRHEPCQAPFHRPRPDQTHPAHPILGEPVCRAGTWGGHSGT